MLGPLLGALLKLPACFQRAVSSLSARTCLLLGMARPRRMALVLLAVASQWEPMPRGCQVLRTNQTAWDPAPSSDRLTLELANSTRKGQGAENKVMMNKIAPTTHSSLGSRRSWWSAWCEKPGCKAFVA